jgi:hypothetical protein
VPWSAIGDHRSVDLNRMELEIESFPGCGERPSVVSLRIRMDAGVRVVPQAHSWPLRIHELTQSKRVCGAL